MNPTRSNPEGIEKGDLVILPDGRRGIVVRIGKKWSIPKTADIDTEHGKVVSYYLDSLKKS